MPLGKPVIEGSQLLRAFQERHKGIFKARQVRGSLEKAINNDKVAQSVLRHLILIILLVVCRPVNLTQIRPLNFLFPILNIRQRTGSRCHHRRVRQRLVSPLNTKPVCPAEISCPGIRHHDRLDLIIFDLLIGNPQRFLAPQHTKHIFLWGNRIIVFRRLSFRRAVNTHDRIFAHLFQFLVNHFIIFVCHFSPPVFPMLPLCREAGSFLSLRTARTASA